MYETDGDWWEGALALVAEPGGAAVGPAAMRFAAWMQTRDELLGHDESHPAIQQAVGQGFVLTPAQALRLGVSRAGLRSHVRRGRWTIARYGVVCPLPARLDERPHGASPEIGVTSMLLARPAATASHESSAILRGLPILRHPERVTLTLANASHAGGWSDCLVRACPIDPSERAAWFGVSTTTVARTIVDIARSSGTAAGLVTADAALREGMVTEHALAASVRFAFGRPGVRAARRTVELADGRAESPLESLTRLLIFDADLPAFEPQVRIPTIRGAYRVDLLCRARRTVVEADGLRKYELNPEALTREKLRQEAIERAGYRVVRVTWDDVVRQPQATVARIAQAVQTPSLP